MNISTPVAVLILLLLVILLLFIIIKNRKDKKELTRQLDEDYQKPKSTHSDIEIEDRKSV